MQKVILLAEDSPYDEEFFKRTLRISGVLNQIRVVRDADQAIAYLNGEGVYADRHLYPLPVALFLDLLMPRADGLVALKWLQSHKEFDDMLVVVLTHFGEGRLLRDAYALGADTFLFKPFTQPDLESLLQHFPGCWKMKGDGHTEPVSQG